MSNKYGSVGSPLLASSFFLSIFLLSVPVMFPELHPLDAIKYLVSSLITTQVKLLLKCHVISGSYLHNFHQFVSMYLLALWVLLVVFVNMR